MEDSLPANAFGRRSFLARAGAGLGLLALGDLLGAGLAAGEPGATRGGHHPAKAKAVIWLYMHGGPSAIDTFDPKPELTRRHGQRLGTDLETFGGTPGPLFRSPFAFSRHGASGAWVSDLYPRLAAHVDRMAFIRSCVAESNSHAPAMYHMNTGMPRVGFPSAGAWATYGLGSANADLPGFVVLGPKDGPKGGPQNWGAGFLPGAHQATLVRDLADPILNLRRAADEDDGRQRRRLDLVARLDGEHQRRCPEDPALAARIASFELAYRMQREAPEAFDLSREDAATRELYGLEAQGATRSFGAKCLLARRLVERGVRFVQLYTDVDWDSHSNLAAGHRARGLETDQPIAALLADLARRGLLDSTLVVWGGEFGRLPISQDGGGRDHNPHGFLIWMAGGGIKGGTSHGETDDLGLKAARDPVTVNDLHATMLHLLGLDHERLTYLHNGRRFRLTDVAGSVIRQLTA